LTHGFEDSAAPVYCIVMLSTLSSASGFTNLILPDPVCLSDIEFGSRDVPSATAYVDLLSLRFPLFAVLSLELRPVNPLVKVLCASNNHHSPRVHSGAGSTTVTVCACRISGTGRIDPFQLPPVNAFADYFPRIFAFGLSSLA
jgi:hypothetical protein